jgi:hypothetical protein
MIRLSPSAGGRNSGMSYTTGNSSLGRFEGQRITLKYHPVPAEPNEIANILMIGALWMQKHIIAVISTKTLQRLQLGQPMQSGEGK